MTKKGSTKIVNFMNPEAVLLAVRCAHISRIVKMIHFLKNLPIYTQFQIRQTESIVMMTKKQSSKMVNHMTPGQGFLY